jgi:hypothetical protein
MTQQLRRTSEFEPGNAQVREVKAKLVRDYIENQALAPKPAKHQFGGANTSRSSELVFSAFDDVKIYGAEAVAQEMRTRQYDPYEAYKERLHAATSEASGTATALRPQPRSLNISVSESA